MFCGGDLHRSGDIAWTSKIDHADMLMCGADPVDIEKSGRKQSAGAWFCRGRSFAEQFNVKPAFFTRFAQRGLFRIFIQLNMPTERQPLVQRAMMDEQDFRLLDHKDRDGEIHLVMNMWHCVFPCTPRSGRAVGRDESRVSGHYGLTPAREMA